MQIAEAFGYIEDTQVGNSMKELIGYRFSR